jgi:hypothetical protein
MQTLTVLNEMLASLGETRLETLATPHHFKDDAIAYLNKARVQALSRGWWFNKWCLKLVPATVAVVDPIAPVAVGDVLLPTDVDILSLQVPRQAGYFSPPIIRRGRKLFDTERYSFSFPSPVEVNVVVDIPLEELPESAAAYVASMAVVQFQSNYDGDTAKTREIMGRIEGSHGTRAALHTDDIRETQANMVYANSALSRIKAMVYRLR